jgi:hypothetical protein
MDREKSLFSKLIKKNQHKGMTGVQARVSLEKQRIPRYYHFYVICIDGEPISR